jgi:hypothetical protein
VALDRDGRLTFRNVAVDADVARAPRAYHAVWSEFDNATGDTRFLGTSDAADAEVVAPSSLPAREGAFLKVELSSSGSDHASWSYPVDAFFRLRAGSWQLAGFDRMPERN